MALYESQQGVIAYGPAIYRIWPSIDRIWPNNELDTKLTPNINRD